MDGKWKHFHGVTEFSNWEIDSEVAKLLKHIGPDSRAMVERKSKSFLKRALRKYNYNSATIYVFMHFYSKKSYTQTNQQFTKPSKVLHQH
jgi:hypothetical protein